MTDQTTDDAKGKKDRSPSFPFISLEKAVERARAVEEKHKNQPTRLQVIAGTWGYGTKSSGLLQTASALRQFGLLEDIGAGADRKLALTDLARKILLDRRPGAREQGLKEAAMNPRLINEYIPIWLGKDLSPEHCISELHLDRGFTEAAAQTFLKIFHETAKFANLENGDSLSSQEIEEAVLSEPTHTDGETALKSAIRRQIVASAPKRSTLALPEGVAIVEMPSTLSLASQNKLAKWLAMMVEFAEVTPEPKAE